MVSVLVVDDDEKFREMLSAVLAAEGYSVKCFGNAWDAVSASEEELFNFALIDIHLPDMLGTDLLSLLRKTEPPTIKIIITGKATLDNSIEAANKGIDGYIVKPFDPKNLISLMEAKLKEQRAKIESMEEKVAEFIELRSEWMSSTAPTRKR